MLSPSAGQVTHALLTRPPLGYESLGFIITPFDLHVLGTPPAFILSQDRTLEFEFCFAKFSFWKSEAFLKGSFCFHSEKKFSTLEKRSFSKVSFFLGLRRRSWIFGKANLSSGLFLLVLSCQFLLALLFLGRSFELSEKSYFLGIFQGCIAVYLSRFSSDASICFAAVL